MPRPEPSEVAACDAFRVAWDHHTGTPTPENPRPENWRGAIRHYHLRRGVGDEAISDAVRIAFEREDVPRSAKFAYVCGILKNYASVAETTGGERARRGRF